MSELGMRKVQILSWLLQNVNLRRQAQRDQQRFDSQQELHLQVFIAIKGGGRPTRLLLYAKMMLVPLSFFLCRVGFSLGGYAFSQSKCDFSRLLHTERSWHTSIYCGFCFWSTGFALWCKSIFVDLFWSVKLIAAEQARGLTFLQSAFSILISKRFSLVPECNVFLQCCILTLRPAL